MAGALSVTALTAGSLEQLIGLGWKTIGELDEFSKAILPAMAAAVAATGSVNTATFQQVTTFFLVETLLSLMDGFLNVPVYRASNRFLRVVGELSGSPRRRP